MKPDKIMTIEKFEVTTLTRLAKKQFDISASEAEALIKLIIKIFREACSENNVNANAVKKITTKFRDAGRRSAPWKPFSSRMAGRPQDGSDGNRINRWLMDEDHKFYATQQIATLVEVKYYLQTLSMENAPSCAFSDVLNLFYPWLIEHRIIPGQYLDPIQLIPMSFPMFTEEARSIQSGHLIPLDLGGKHHPSNTFLMLSRSNQLQGNLKVADLIELMSNIVAKHHEREAKGDLLESRILKK